MRSWRGGLVLGDAFTLGAQRLSVDDEGVVRIDGRPLSGDGRGGDVSKVASLEGRVDSSRFPEIRLKLTPMDKDGKTVEGLSATDFEIADEKEGVGVTMLANRAAPRVLFLADQSLSMPDAFPRSIYDRFGGSAFVKMPKRFIRTRRSIYAITGSELWYELLAASSDTVSLVVFATDGDVTGQAPDESGLRALKAGPPCFVLDVMGQLEELRNQGRLQCV